MFKLQNRYQDEGWEELGIRFEEEWRALRRALECSSDAISYGMIRIINEDTGEIVATFGAGEGSRR